MRFEVLSSGSKGNTTYIETNGTKIIVDMGNSCKYVVEKLAEIGVDPNDIDAIMLTHIHTDHTNGLKTFLKKYKTKVYLAGSMLKYLAFIDDYFIIDTNVCIGDLLRNIDIVRTSHDVEDSFGYVVNNLDKSIVYITDTGYINQRYFDLLKNKDAYVIESNHDVDMLMSTSRPLMLKKRILSDNGHLSNDDCARVIRNCITSNTKKILLAHISQQANTYQLAYQTMTNMLNQTGLNRSDLFVKALQQYQIYDSRD